MFCMLIVVVIIIIVVVVLNKEASQIQWYTKDNTAQDKNKMSKIKHATWYKKTQIKLNRFVAKLARIW